MRFILIIRQSIIALKANKMRSILSILGIVIGVGAVVLILSLGNGLKGLVTQQVEAFGPNLLAINVKIPGSNQASSVMSMAQGIKITTLDLENLKAFQSKERFPYIEAATGQAIGQDWLSYKDKEKRVLLYGGSSDLLQILKTAKIKQGRFFTKAEDDGLAQVVVLGNGLADDFFKNEDPLNKKIKLAGQSYQIIGVLSPQSGMSFGGVDINNFIYMPLKTILKKILGINYLTEIDVVIKNQSYLTQAIEEISRFLRFEHHIASPDKDDFQITTAKDILDTVNKMGNILNLLLGFLAAISLLVGGVGIMNIMLVSVSERVKEIGLRKALGASQSNILWQFLIEALLITGLGGLVGIIGGISYSLIGALIIRKFGLAWPMTVSWLAIITAFAVAAGIGLVFGVYPARKAARLNPIEALRRE